MTDRILVPLDGSSLSEKALPYARSLARILPAELALVRAIAIPRDAHPLFGKQETTTLLGQLEAEAGRYLDGVAAGMRAENVATSTVVRVGPAAEAIVDLAAELKPATIVMATHGYSGAARWSHGSIAERVLRSASVPVLMIPAGRAGELAEDRPFRRILVPLDGSATAERALEPAIRIARAAHAEMTLLRVSIIHTTGEFAGDLLLPLEGSLQTANNLAQTYLKGVAQGLAERHVWVSTVVEMGPVVESILDYSANHEVDLIAMCTHGQTGLTRWALGRVADRILRHGGVPILLVRAA